MVKLLLVCSIFVSSAVLASPAGGPTPQDRRDSQEPPQSHELRQLRHEVQGLRQDIVRLERLILRELAQEEPAIDVRGDKWGCYMQDLSAGGLYSTGRTEAEAKGKLLERCTQKNGSCFASKAVCSTD